MAYENKKVADIYALLAAGCEQEFNQKFRLLPKSFLHILFKVFSGVYVTLYKLIGWYFLQIFPATASWQAVSVLGVELRPLVQWGRLLGIGGPNEAKPWAGKGTIQVLVPGKTLTAGAQFVSSVTGKVYVSTTSVLLAGQTATIDLQCTSGGTAGNLTTTDLLTMVNPLGIIGKTVVVTTTTTPALDAEEESQYRARVVSRYQVQPQGGALADYRSWAAAVPGVLQTYVYKDLDSATGVLLYIAGVPDVYPDRIVNSALCTAVGNACTYDPVSGMASRKPLGATLDPDYNGTYRNIHTVSIKDFVVYVSGVSGIDADDYALAAKSLVGDYFLSREPYIRGLSVDADMRNRVSANNVRGILDNIASNLKAEFVDVVIKQGGFSIDGSYELAQGELVRLSGFHVNGIPF